MTMENSIIKNEELISQFYSAFKKSDSTAMNACYHKDIEFSDPLFSLKGVEAKAMWNMLLERKAKPEARSFGKIKASLTTGEGEWEAHYTFPQTGRKIHNKVKATFVFKDGKIIKHRDDFDFYQWNKMAFGFFGVIFGWTQFFQNKIQRKARERLRKYMLGI